MAFRKKCLDCGKFFSSKRKRCNLYEGCVIFSLSCIDCYLEYFPETFRIEEPKEDETRTWKTEEKKC